MQKVRPIPKPERPRYYFRAWRKYRGLTQEQLAERVGMSVSSVSQVETGKQGFTDESLSSFAVALDCTPGDLLSRDPNIDSAIFDLMALIRQKDAAAPVLALLRALPDKTGTNG